MTALPAAPTRPIRDDEVERFWTDGVVCLRGIMPLEWLEAMADPLEVALRSSATADLSTLGDTLAEQSGAARLVDDAVVAGAAPRGHFLGGLDHWREQPEFLDLAVASPLPAIVAAVLKSQSLWFYEDSVLVKEPGTQERTAYHRDMSYFHLSGHLVATTWVPLDQVTAATGAVRFVVGSHRDRTRYRANTFVTDLDIGGDPDAVAVPDFDVLERSGVARIVSFDTEPGDITVHHACTIHGAPGNSSATQRRRAISVRYAGDGTTFAPVPGLAKPHHAGMTPGQPLDPAACPAAWPR